MRIGIITSLRKECGIGIYTFELLKYLKKINEIREIHVFTHTDADIKIKNRKIKIYKVIDEKTPNYVPKMKKMLERKNLDIIDLEWEHGLYAPQYFLGTFLFPLILSLKDKLFTSFHSLYTFQDFKRALKISKNFNNFISEVGALYYKLTKTFLIKNLKVGRVFSIYEYNQIRKKDKKKFIIVPEGIERTYNQKPVNGRYVNLTIFGFIRLTKDYNLAISALNLLPKKFRLIIAGKPQKNELVGYIRALIKKYRVKDRVILIPRFLSEREKIKLMEKTHILLLPYLLISNSGVLMDGIEYLRPIVSTVLKDDIEMLRIGKYSEHNKESFSEAILNLYNNYEEYINNIKEVQKEFLWKNVIWKIIEGFYKVLE
jgi:glycosyltransferase involved in cell wall biosynthesis